MTRITIAMLFAVLIVGCGSGQDAAGVPSRNVVDGAVNKENSVSDKEMEQRIAKLIQDSANRKRVIWATESLDSFDQGQSFNKWAKDKSLSAEATVAIRKWINREFTDLPDEWTASFVDGVGVKESLVFKASDAGVFVVIDFSYVGKDAK